MTSEEKAEVSAAKSAASGWPTTTETTKATLQAALTISEGAKYPGRREDITPATAWTRAMPKPMAGDSPERDCRRSQRYAPRREPSHRRFLPRARRASTPRRRRARGRRHPGRIAAHV